MKFMESFLASRPKVAQTELETGVPSMDESPYSGMGGLDQGFGAGLTGSGGFQSLRDALLEAGSVVKPGAVPSVQHVHHAHDVDESEAAVHQEPAIELVTNEGRIEKIIVTCSCGRRIEMDCTY